MIYIAKGDVVQLDYDLYAVANSEKELLIAVAQRLANEYPTDKELQELLVEIQVSTGVELTPSDQYPHGLWTGLNIYQADETYDELPKNIGNIFCKINDNSLHFEIITSADTILEEYNEPRA